jgi:hypothetical protein
MKSSARRSARSSQSRLVVLHALRTWVVPSVAIAVGCVVYFAHNLGLIEPLPAITTVGSLALLLTLFWGVRDFLDPDVGAMLRLAVVGFVGLWGIAIYLPFYLALNPGAAAFSAELRRSGPPVSVPLHDTPGRYNLVVESHFPGAERMHNRTGTYRITVARNGTTDRVAEGTFHQDWHNERVGAGRRSFLVPAMSETTRVLNVIDDPDGHDLTIQLTDLSGDVGDSVKVQLYPERVPNWALMVAGALTLLAAMVLDTYRPRTASEGVLATATVAALVGVLTIRATATVTPGFPQLLIAVLIGAVGGTLAGTLLSRATRPLRKYLPARA